MVKILLKHRASVDLLDDDERTPLHLAASGGHSQVAKLLLEAKSKINQLDKRKSSPLEIAARKGHVDMVKILLGTIHKPQYPKSSNSMEDFFRSRANSIRDLLKSLFSVRL